MNGHKEVSWGQAGEGEALRAQGQLGPGLPWPLGDKQTDPLFVWKPGHISLVLSVLGSQGRRCQAQPSPEGAAAIVFLGEEDCFSPGATAPGPGGEEREKLQKL